MGTLSPKQIAAAAIKGGIGQSSGGFSGAGIASNTIVVMVAIALAESGGNPDATHHNPNGSTDYGLWQINSIHSQALSSGNWRDPVDNARMAKMILDTQGFGAWTTYNTGAYRQNNRMHKALVGYHEVREGTLDEILDAIQHPVATAEQALVNQIPGLKKFSDAVQALTNPDTWIRIGQITGGGLLVLVAVTMLALGETRIDNALVKLWAFAKVGGIGTKSGK